MSVFMVLSVLKVDVNAMETSDTRTSIENVCPVPRVGLSMKICVTIFQIIDELGMMPKVTVNTNHPD